MQKNYYTNKDEESDLGDYGVRKYDDLTGRFTATDPLWEKYYGWSPYVYSGNDPVNKVDLDGRDIIVLLDKEGANGLGHSAVLIGNDDSGWNLFSKNGGEYGLFGKSKYQDGESFNTLNLFYNDQKETQIRYEKGFRIETNSDEDKRMRESSSKQVQENYWLIGNSCNNTSEEALRSIGLNYGESFAPNIRFNQIIEENKFGSILRITLNPQNYQWETTYNNRNTSIINIDYERNRLTK